MQRAGRDSRGAEPLSAPGNSAVAAGARAAAPPPQPRAHSPQPPRRGPARAGRAAAAAPGGRGSPRRPSPRSALPARRPAELGPGRSDSAPLLPAAFGLGAPASHPPRRSQRPGVGTRAGAGPVVPPLSSPLLSPPRLLTQAEPAAAVRPSVLRGHGVTEEPGAFPPGSWGERGGGAARGGGIWRLASAPARAVQLAEGPAASRDSWRCPRLLGCHRPPPASPPPPWGRRCSAPPERPRAARRERGPARASPGHRAGKDTAWGCLWRRKGRIKRGGSEARGGSPGCMGEAVPGAAGGSPSPQRPPAASRGAPGHWPSVFPSATLLSPSSFFLRQRKPRSPRRDKVLPTA